MKNYSNIYIIFFASSFLSLLIIGCNPTSTANILFDGTNNDRSNNNTLLFGRVVDKDTNEPLVGANVTLKDYNIGSATDIYGNYLIKDIPPGIYNVKGTYVGYKVLNLSDIKLDNKKRYLIDFELQLEPFVLP
jgi:hypothetical protein